MPDAVPSATAAPNTHIAPYAARGLKGRILSGVQPTGNLHLGNYLGAIRNFARLQGDYECLYCVVDMHAITAWQEPQQLASQTREIASAFWRPASMARSRSSSTSRWCRNMPSSPGSSIAWRAWAG